LSKSALTPRCAAQVSNIGGADLAEALASDVQRLIVPPSTDSDRHHHSQSSAAAGPQAPGWYEIEQRQRTMLCKKGALCLLRLFRTNPDVVILSDWVTRLVSEQGSGMGRY
jgi:hypothetical protein